MPTALPSCCTLLSPQQQQQLELLALRLNLERHLSHQPWAQAREQQISFLFPAMAAESTAPLLTALEERLGIALLPKPYFANHTDYQAVHAALNQSGAELIGESLVSARELYEMLSRIHESFLATSSADTVQRSRTGAFYTPERLVTFMLKRCLSGWLQPLDIKPRRLPTLLDPACGSGAFLISAFEMLENAKIGSATQVLRSIYGIDRDELAVALCRLTLFCAGAERGLAANGALYELLSTHILAADTLLDADLTFADPQQRGGFDYIVGNPPYGLSRDEQMTDQENEQLKLRYERFRCGKANKYLLFIARGLELLGPRGSLTFVVPNAWLGIKGGKKLRELLLNERSLSELTIIDENVFGEPGVEVVVMHVDRARAHAQIALQHADTIGEIKTVTHVPIAACLNNPDTTIPTRWADGVSEILEKIDAASMPLESPNSLFIPLIALQAYATGKGTPKQSQDDVKKRIYDRRQADDENTLPYLEGRDVARYQINWSGGYLKYGPWLAEFQPRERFTGPRVLVREITCGWPHVLSAAYCDQTFLYNRSVLHILPKANATSADLIALAALLNSRLASFLILMRGRKSQRKIFPKIVNDDLSDFRVPRAWSSIVELLGAVAQQPRRSDEEIDSLVYQTFGIRLQEQQLIERLLS